MNNGAVFTASRQLLHDAGNQPRTMRIARPLLAGRVRTVRTRATRVLRGIAVLVATTVAAIVVVASPASASQSFFFTDFEDNDAFKWSFTHSGPGLGGFSSHALSGIRSVDVFMQGSGFSSVGRTFLLSHTKDCDAGLFVDQQASIPVTVNLEVINPSNFTYVGLATYTLPVNTSWTPISVHWDAGPSTVLIRLSVLGDASGKTTFVWADDFGYTCKQV